MHAIERPHLPRVGLLGLAAVLVAIVALFLAASVGREFGMSSGSSPGRGLAGKTARTSYQAGADSSAFTNVFVPPFHAVVFPWTEVDGR